MTVVLSDVSDEANGSASSIPYTFINAYGVPPDSLDELNDFDDYMKLLITHEFTHVVHLDTMLSICPLAINTVLGRTYAPNLAEPTWFIEGMAVLMESRQTTAGRLRSSFYDMHLRVPFLEGRMFRFDQISSIPNAYPQGTAAYLYGSSLLRYIEDRYGPHKIREISHRYADTCIPGGLNRTADQGGRERLRRNLRPRPLGRLAPGDRPPLHARRSRTPSCGRSPAATRLTWEAPSPRSEGPGRAVPARRHAGLSPQQQRSVPRLRPPRSHDRRAPARSPTCRGADRRPPRPTARR